MKKTIQNDGNAFFKLLLNVECLILVDKLSDGILYKYLKKLKLIGNS